MQQTKDPCVASGFLLCYYHQACQGQTRPDGKNCKICGDSDHQAFECFKNPFVMFITALKGLDTHHYFPK